VTLSSYPLDIDHKDHVTSFNISGPWEPQYGPNCARSSYYKQLPDHAVTVVVRPDFASDNSSS
jgi:hypothetical protein